jgi:hypothetical protein
MRHKDLLHTVNNQLEVITSAAEVLNLRSHDASTQDLCAMILSAALNTSAALTPYVMERISEEEGTAKNGQPMNPAKRAVPLSPTVE